MKGFPSVVTALGLACVVALPAAAAETKWVRGQVTVVTATSVTVKVQGGDMTFVVDNLTDISGPGLGTKTREAVAAGKKGIALTEAVTAGDRIEVHYTAGSPMKAVEIRTGVRGGANAGGADTAASENEGKSVRGLVTVVTDSSFTVKGDDGEWTFMVDSQTRVVGEGLGTMAREKQESGAGRPTIADSLKVNDRVAVSYREMGTMKHASDVRVVRKAM